MENCFHWNLSYRVTVVLYLQTYVTIDFNVF